MAIFYVVYFLTLLALFSAIFFISAVYSARGLDRLFGGEENRRENEEEKEKIKQPDF